MLEELNRLLTEMHSETEYNSFDFSLDKSIEYVNKLINSGQFVYVDSGVVMLGTCSECWFGSDKVANDTLLYVSKDERGKGLAKKAVSEFIKWADAKGVKAVFLGHTTGVNPEAFQELVKHSGFREAGAVFVR